MCDVGSFLEISRREDAVDFEWRIPGSDTELLGRGEWLFSPFLSFAGWRWQLVLRRKDSIIGRSPLELSLYGSGGQTSVRYWLGAVKGQDGEEIGRGRMGSGSFAMNHSWLPFPELRRRMRCSASSSGTLSVIVRLRTGPETDGEMKSLIASSKLNEKSTQTDLKGYELSDECVLCCAKAVDCVLYRCGHMCMCYKCAMNVKYREASAQCPICRKPIRDVIKVYK